MLTPHQYQLPAIEHLYQLARAGVPAEMNGSDMGVGKTLMAIELMRRLDRATLAVVPKVTIPSWHRHAAEQGTSISTINWEMVRTGRTPYGHWNGDDFVWDPAIEFLIFDEVHRAMGRETRNSQLVRAARRQGIFALAMSATVADNPLEMDATGFLLRLHDGYRPKTTLRDLQRGYEPVSFNQWCAKRGCRLLNGEWGFWGSEGQLKKHMAKINAEIYPSRGVRVRIAELGDQFPDQQVTAELYDLDEPGRIEGLYEKMAAAIAALKERTDFYGDSVLSDILKELQQIELLKVPVIVDQAREAIDAGRKVAIFVKYSLTIDELCRRLDSRCIIDGSQTGEKGAREREQNRLAFVEDKSRVIICNGDAGGAGLDLPDKYGKHPCTSLVSTGFNAKTTRQIVGRTRRADSVTKSQVRFIFATGEESLHRSVSRKLNNLDALNDADCTPENLRISRKF